MICPKCRMSNLENVRKCVCGYEFVKSSGSDNQISNNPFSAPKAGKSIDSANPGSPADGDVTGSSGGGNREPLRFNFLGTGSELFSIYIVNFLLIIATFGIYYFWGKAKIKRYMYSQSEFDGDRFTFHGTGNELFKGGMIAIGFLVIYSLVSEYVNKFISTTAGLIASSLIGFLFLFAVVSAIVLSRRYYLSRTTWRGIRFSFRGYIKDFTVLFFKGYFLSFITLGIYIPYFINNYQEFMISNSYFGNQNFRYKGKGSDIFNIFIKIFISSFIVFFSCFWIISYLFGLIAINSSLKFESQSIILFIIILFAFLILPLQYFRYWLSKYKWNHTSFLGTGFNLEFKFLDYLRLKIGNALILIFTLGFGWPWVAVRNAKFLTKYLTMDGGLDFEVIKQKMIDTSATGESVADIFDIDAGLDIGI